MNFSSKTSHFTGLWGSEKWIHQFAAASVGVTWRCDYTVWQLCHIGFTTRCHEQSERTRRNDETGGDVWSTCCLAASAHVTTWFCWPVNLNQLVLSSFYPLSLQFPSCLGWYEQEMNCLISSAGGVYHPPSLKMSSADISWHNQEFIGFFLMNKTVF